MRSPPVRHAFVASALAFAALTAHGQEDLVRPPRIDETPGAVRLAAPAPRRRPPLEEVIVTSESEWRLPDLGSEWRMREADEPTNGRMAVAFLPLYDPERPQADFDPLRINRELQQVGFLELFRVSFGRRAPP